MSTTYIPFPPMALLRWTAPDEPPTYWRYITHDNQGGDAENQELGLWVLQVELGVTPKSSRAPLRWKKDDVGHLINNAITRIDECIRLPFMDEDPHFSDEDVCNVTLKDEWVQLLIGDGLPRYLSSEEHRVRRLEEVSLLAGVPVSRLMTVLTRYFWYGGGKGALYPLRPNQGGPGVSRLDSTDTKMGRHNANVVLDPDTKYRGVNMSRELLDEWRELLRLFYPLGPMVSNIYRDHMLPRLANIPGHLRQEERLFLWYGYKIVKDEKLKEKRVGRIAWEQEHAARTGSSTDGVFGAIDTYDLDGMEYKIHLVYGKRRMDVVGRPTVILAVCRRSRAVVGWYVTMKWESGNTYKHCLFSAFTSKIRTLARLGITEKLKGLVYGACDQVYFDRGPGISKSVSAAVTEELRLDQPFAPPRRADLKAVVEGVNGIFQRRTADLPGAYRRTGERADKERQDAAQDDATMTTLEFEQTLVYAVNEYNLTADVDQVWTHEMVKDEVEPNPAAIFRWYRAPTRRGASRELTERELYVRLLEPDTRTVQNGRVRYGKGQYTSEELVDFYNAEKQRPREPDNPIINIRVPMDDPTYLLWERTDGSFVELTETVNTAKRFGPALRFDRKYGSLVRAAKRRVMAAKNAPGNLLAKAKSAVVEKATAKQQRPDTYKTGANVTEARREFVGEETAHTNDTQREVLGMKPRGVKRGEAEFSVRPEPPKKEDQAANNPVISPETNLDEEETLDTIEVGGGVLGAFMARLRGRTPPN